ncbi:holin [Virgibacillus sp. DJP39]|uniref:holin n=1 Tax=Virgibacillus sp. DJP39 TaxID=3409790 RepID=UPI003BB5FE61
MQNILVFASILSPVVTALVELAKKSISLPKNILPLLSIVIGLGVGAAAYPFTDMDLVLRLWAGGFAGLAGTGLFELFKKRKGITKQRGIK